MNIIDAFRQLGSYRAAARLCGTTDKTVKRAVERQQLGGPWTPRPRLSSKNTDAVMAIIGNAFAGPMVGSRPSGRCRASARRGLSGGRRNFRRAVFKGKAEWRQKRRLYRPVGANAVSAPVGGLDQVGDTTAPVLRRPGLESVSLHPLRGH